MRLIEILRIMFLPPSGFPTKELEDSFLRDYSGRFLSHRRAAIIIGLCTWTLYIGWDLFHARMNPEFSGYFIYVLYGLRFAGITVLSISAYLMYTPISTNEEKVTLIMMFGISSCYALLLIMIYILPFPYDYLYYFIGLLLVLFFMFGFVRLRARSTLYMASFFIFISAISFYADSAENLASVEASRSIVHGYYWWAAMSYLLSFIIIGCGISVELERTARQSFWREIKLEEAHKETRVKTEAILKLKDDATSIIEQKNRDKSEFIARASHDLKQPMQAVDSFLEAALYSINNGDINQSRELIEGARKGASVMRSTLNAVLDISRLEVGGVKAHYDNFDVYALAEEIVHSMISLAAANGVCLRLTKRRKRKAIVTSDRVLLGRVISNIVSNAIKYSDIKKGVRASVVVGVIPLPKYVRVEVIDNGIGIPISQQQNIFKPFQQLNNPGQEIEKGLGLGLAIVNAIVNMLKEHRLEVSSIENVGSRFSIELPIGENEISIPYVEESDNIKISNLDGAYVLLVEDDKLLRNATLKLLQHNGALCDTTSSFEEMNEKIQQIERYPDVVLTDYRLPNARTAVDVVQAVKDVFGDDIPIIVMTGESDIGSHADLINIKVLRKPVPPKELVSELGLAIRVDTARLV